VQGKVEVQKSKEAQEEGRIKIVQKKKKLVKREQCKSRASQVYPPGSSYDSYVKSAINHFLEVHCNRNPKNVTHRKTLRQIIAMA